MSQAVITKAFTEWKAQQAVNNQPVTLDEFVFAYIPDLDVDKPIGNTEPPPAADKIVHRQAVSKSGVVNGNSVVYSVTLGADVGDFDFNWIGLINKASGTLAMIIHAPAQRKIKNASGQQGNVLVRSMLMEYSGAQAATQITTPAETWQIDFTARLAAMDERQRLENIDLYGAAAFFGTGYLVAKSGTQFYVTKGAGYVAGLRAELAANQNITVSAKPVKVWLDVAWSGTLTSEWAVKSKITVAANLSDYAESGVRHYVFALASIDASGTITELRPVGALVDQSLLAHEKSRNHPDATTKEKGFTKLNSAVDSDSETESSTPKATKLAYDKAKAAEENANGRVPSNRKVNGRALTEDINVTAQDIFNGQTVGIGNAADLNAYTTPGLYFQPANAQAQTGKNYPESAAGSLEVIKHAGITQIYRIYNSSRSHIRTLYASVWTGWAKQYDTENKPTAAEVDAVSAANGGTYKKTVAFEQGLLAKGKITVADDAHAVGESLYNAMINTTDSGGKNRCAFGPYQNGWSIYNYKPDGSYVRQNFNIDFDTGAARFADSVTATYSGNFAWAAQYGASAPFYNAYASSGNSEYRPLIKQQAAITGKSAWAFSMGSLVNGSALSWHLHMKSSGTDDVNFKWETNGNFTAPGQLIAGNYANFDVRYYTKAQSDAGYMPRTGAYTKDESNARYLTDTRLGARNYRLMTKSTMFEIAGNIITGLQIEGEVDGNGDYIVMRPLQKMLNGTWYTVAQV